MSGSAAVAAIESNWATFFNAKTPLARRLALLENGPQFTAIVKAQQGQGLAALATSKVSHVSLTGTDHASVTYTIYIGGHPQLKNQPGVAVYQDGVWKVGDSSFCGLLKLEQVAALPPACKA
jgi:hypothetical protein